MRPQHILGLRMGLIGLSACLLFAQDPPTPPAAEAAKPETPIGGARANAVPEPKPYDRVVTKEFKTDEGVFLVHRNRDRVLYEIPKSELGKEFLWVNQIRRTTIGVGYGGQALGNRVVKWELKDRRVLLKNVNYEVVADAKLPISQAVHDANEDAIIMAFNVEAFSKNGDPVIDVSRLFTTDVAELSARARLRARAMDSSRSFIEKVVSYPTNVEVDAVQTYTTPVDPPTPGQTPAPAPNPFMGSGMRPGTGTVTVHYSMVKLPENPMMPRLEDDRVGYFSISQMDYGRPEFKATKRNYITRWRLDKKDPNAAVSEPVKQIVYYVDPATPTQWVPYVKKGIEAWQPAFEAAGFKNAIIAKEAPSKEVDPDWSPEDARYSVVRWLPSTIENAVGPHVHDPRTGEILESDVQMYHNIQNLVSDWYFTQASPNDPRAQKYPLPEPLVGRLIEYVVAHEVGHTLGLPHNMKSSSQYPIEKIRDPKWVKENSHVATLMDYSRYNYVAQPDDKIAAEDLIPKIGPYDKFVIQWGYMPVPGAKTPDEEKTALNALARKQENTPWLRFSTDGANGSDPGDLTEAVGDADAIQATALGLKNLERVSGYLLQATEEPGENWEQLARVYSRVLGQWSLEMGHVAAIVGGYDSQQLHGGQTGVRFKPVPKARQAAAVQFLLANGFVVPKWALNPEVLRRIEPDGAVSRVKTAQTRIMTSLMSPARLNRLVEQEALDGASAYGAAQFLTDLRKGVFSELTMTQVKVDPFRRNTQRIYIDAVNERLNGRAAANDDIKALLRAELKALNGEAGRAAATTTDKATKAHLQDVQDQIAKILDPKFAPPAPVAATGFGGQGRPGIDPDDVYSCWPDYGIYATPDPRQ